MKRVFALVALMLTAVACAQTKTADSAGSGDRTVEVEMRNSHFSPATLDVRKGQTVTFHFVNGDRVAHEAFVGDATMQQSHEDEMKMGMRSGHATPMSMIEQGAMITVSPGKSGQLTHTFTESSLIGCHEPGHYKAGMVMTISVR